MDRGGEWWIGGHEGDSLGGIWCEHEVQGMGMLKWRDMDERVFSSDNGIVLKAEDNMRGLGSVPMLEKAKLFWEKKIRCNRLE